MNGSRVRFTIALALTAMLLFAAPALAAKGGKGKGRGGTATSFTLTGPTEAYVGDTYTITGTGFQPGTGVTLTVGEAGGCCYVIMTMAGADGTFTYSGNVWGPGAYTFAASVPTTKGYQLAATYSFQAS